MLDLQRDWRPSTFQLGLVEVPCYPSAQGECWCLGPQTPAEKAEGLCPCGWEAKYGPGSQVIEEIFLIVPPVRGCRQ